MIIVDIDLPSPNSIHALAMAQLAQCKICINESKLI